MFACQRCMRQLLQAVLGETGYVSTTSYSNCHTAAQSTLQKLTIPRLFYSSSHQRKIISKRASDRQTWFVSKNVRSPALRPKKNLRSPGCITYSINQDPLRLAEFVQSSLKKDEVEIASDAVRRASNNMQCVVSWNHLIDWWMSKGKMKSAIGIFHEMKKRGQTPDAYTYTIIFRGCAQHEHSEQALGKVLGIYQSMLLDKSPVKPNSIHMNSVLKMCAVAGDVESMISIASTMPSRGLGASNAMTFVIILNALRYNATSHLPEALSPKQLTENIRAAILQATLIWDDIMNRWRKKDFIIDEELVCSMGRMLLLSEEKRHWDEVLSIVEQTMAIPRQIPPLDSPDRWKIEPNCQGRKFSEPPAGSQSESDFLVQENTQNNSSDPTAESLFGALNTSLEPTESLESSIITTPISPSVEAYAKAGRNSLSLVLKALLLLSKKEPATKYWKIFTEKHQVIPDLENYVSYLRILRLSRASTEAVQLVNEIPASDREPKVFRISMGACARDKKNPHVFSNAGKILDMMKSSLKEPDLPTMKRYLDLAISTAPFEGSAPGSNTELVRKDPGKQILRALDRVEEIFLTVKSVIFFTDPGLGKMSQSNRQAYLLDIDGLIRLSISGLDLLIRRELVPASLLPELKGRLYRLNHLRMRLKKQRGKTMNLHQEERNSESLRQRKD